MSTQDHPDWWKNIGGQNSQDSILERRSLIYNDSEILDGTDPAPLESAEIYKGKFFTRGCRGMIESIQIYCEGDAADALTIRYSSHPGIGPFGEATIIPAAAWAWQDFPLEEMWNYDSLFIWVHACEANVDWAYDAEEPYDGHESGDTGATWEDMAIRPFIRAVLTGETPGDVPVSGIVNNIPLPHEATEIANGADVAVNLVNTLIATGEGAGEVLMVRVIALTAVAPAAGVVYTVRIYADGAQAIWINNRDLTQSVIATTGRSSCGEFYQDATTTTMNIRIPVNFRRNIQVYFEQSSGGNVNTNAYVHANRIR